MVNKTYKVLYTHQKTKKSKVWQDGLLKEDNNTKLTLIADNGRYLESVFTKADNIAVGDEIESDAHLILIDEIAKENIEPNTTKKHDKSTSSVDKAPPYRPKFVSKKFTPPTMRRPPPITVSEENSTQSQRVDCGANSNLLGKFQSRKVVRKGPSLVTSLSRTFQSISEKASDEPSLNQSTPYSPTPSDLPYSLNISNRSEERVLEPEHKVSSRNLSTLLEMPDTQRDKTIESESALLSTPAIKEQRSIESIFKALNGESSGSLSQNTDCVSKPILEVEKVPEECQDRDSRKFPDTPSTCNFDLFDETLFSPSPPKRSSGLSTVSQENNQSFSSSLDGFIDDKIEEIANTVPEKERMPQFKEADSRNSSEDETDIRSSCYETVDYFDIFGDGDRPVETFSPTVVQLSTQREDEGERNSTNVATGNINSGNDKTNSINSLHSSTLDIDIPSCGMWDIGNVTDEEVKHGGKSRVTELARHSKRRKLGNIFTNPRSVPDSVERPSFRGFTVPVRAGTKMQFQGDNQTANQELKFGTEPHKRRQVIPLTFSSTSLYQTTMLDVVYEHLNVSLAKICEKYERLMEHTNRQTDKQTVRCSHGPAKVCTVSKDGPNKGRQFYSCKMRSCSLFQWTESNVVPTSPQERFNYFNRQGLSLYTGCQIKRKANSNLYMLHLTAQDKHINYNKDDIWIVDSGSPRPSIMKSTFYGPTSSGQVELKLFNSHVPRCTCSVDALQALRGVAELEIISALDKIHTLPLLPALVCRQPGYDERVSGDISLVEDTEEICISMCREYHLNEKQEEAVVALINSIKHGPPVLCIHGVFGSGKSYLLAVIVLILMRVLGGLEHRVLITSTTNFAVDNILIKLLELGFEHFVRVGSVKRIHKKITPYVLQHQDCESNNFLKQDQNKSVLSRYQVVGTTCASSPAVSNHDIVLFDEVSQVTEPSSLLPLIHSSCKRLVLVGDPQQLPPTVETQHEDGERAGGLEQTLFDRMVKLGYPTVMLK